MNAVVLVQSHCLLLYFMLASANCVHSVQCTCSGDVIGNPLSVTCVGLCTHTTLHHTVKRVYEEGVVKCMSCGVSTLIPSPPTPCL